ncbi:MAG: hypothetical protein EP343_26005 [Deltaproteobacteria bacterium]|nr:MAG: hypothetical protein EP343_26005 [Deltaproteobacteria bacterium]
MDFVVSAIHCVRSVEEASSFFLKQLGFEQVVSDEDSVTVSNGSVQVRLVSSETPEHTMTLEVRTKRLERARQRWLSVPEVQSVSEVQIVRENRHEVLVQAPHSVNILLVRHLTEDDLGVLPPLPTQLDWEAEADTYTRHILRCIPISFREDARVKITEAAEVRAAEEGEITVNLETALRVFVKETPFFQRRALWEEYERLGLDAPFFFEEVGGYPEEE